jgi:hypothetical protein
MLTKVKDFWNNMKEVAKDKAAEVKELMKKLPKSNPDVEVEWKDGQPEFKKKAKKDKPKK